MDQCYDSFEEFYADLGETYRKVVRAFGDAGCRYLQLDEVYMIVLVDPKQRQFFIEHGNDPEKLPGLYSNATNTALKDKPADMVTAMHLCRGNFRSTFQGAGGYDAIADILFNRTNIDAYFMEYDTERAGAAGSQGQEGGARPRDIKDRQARIQGRDQAPGGGGDQIHRPRSALSQPAMRLCQHRGRQSAFRAASAMMR
jgi:methionine synthase II (cobalamin-independent)